MAIEAEDFAPVCETLFAFAMKSPNDLVQAEYPDLKLDFLEVEDEEEIEDTQSGSAQLGAEGQWIASANNETVNQDHAKDDDAVDTPLSAE